MTRSSTQVLSARGTVLAAAATFTLVGGVSAAATAPANAATPECGGGCISVFSSELGTFADPNFVEAVLDGGTAQVGQPVGLKPASGTDPSEDFKPGGGHGRGHGLRLLCGRDGVRRGEQPLRPPRRGATEVRAVRGRDRLVRGRGACGAGGGPPVAAGWRWGGGGGGRLFPSRRAGAGALWP